MRDPFPTYVEDCRIRHGKWKSDPGDPFGSFEIKIKTTHTAVTALVMVGDGLGWDHVSVSIKGRRRCPTWEEMSKIKKMFFKPDECVVQYHPKDDNYINIHNFVLHMWRIQKQEFPTPPEICV